MLPSSEWPGQGDHVMFVIMAGALCLISAGVAGVGLYIYGHENEASIGVNVGRR